MTDDDLMNAARAVAGERALGTGASAGSVGAALVTDRGDVFAGVCIDMTSSIGFCAEHAAVAAMITARQSRIAAIVAVHEDGRIFPPCGRCREMVLQADVANAATRVLIAPGKAVRLSDLLPHWRAEV